MHTARAAIHVFELSSSPHGQLVSLEPDSALARSIAGLPDARCPCWIDGLDLVVSSPGLELAFVGAEPFCSDWPQSPRPTYLCSLPPGFPLRARALALAWESRPPSGPST